MSFLKRKFTKIIIMALASLILAFTLIKSTSSQNNTTTGTTGNSGTTGITPVQANPESCVAPSGSITEQLLYCIRQHTNDILFELDAIPAYISSWLTTTEVNNPQTYNSFIPQLTTDFQTLTQNFTDMNTARDGVQPTIVSYFFVDPTDPKHTTPISPGQLPAAPDANFQNLLGFPIKGFNPDPRIAFNKAHNLPPPDPLQNYFNNISSINILHPLPNPTWQGTYDRIQRYNQYYFAMSAAQTYNAYVLSNLYSYFKTNSALTNTQKDLIKQATDPNWFVQIGADPLGLVLRHLLVFDSQIYVLLTRLLDTQRQALMTQAVTNTILIASALGNEDTLIKQANNTIPP